MVPPHIERFQVENDHQLKTYLVGEKFTQSPEILRSTCAVGNSAPSVDVRIQGFPLTYEDRDMNQIIWIVGAVVIVLAILGFFGLR